MDLNMPVMNGIEASRRLQQSFQDERLPWMPIVMCTAYGNDEALAAKNDSGIVEVVNKPLKFETLGRILEKWMMSSQSL
jgi:CheY-like chemotaxis protein